MYINELFQNICETQTAILIRKSILLSAKIPDTRKLVLPPK